MIPIPQLLKDLAPGTIHTLIGGDGAGKTTILRNLAFAHRSGNANSDIPVSYQPATSGVWPNLSVRENLEFISQTFGMPTQFAANRIDELIHLAGLSHAEHRIGRKLSGGMRQKLGVIMAMLPKPQLLLLDEPTTGVDSKSRITMWELITQAAQEGTTVVLATTYLDEAEKSDQVYLLDKGQLLAAGTPPEICASAPGIIWQCHIDADAVLSMESIRIWRRGKTMYQWSPETHAEPPANMATADFDLDLATVAFLLQNTPDNRPKFPIHIDVPSGKPLVDVQQATKRFGSFTALNNVSMKVCSGEIVGLIGSNGAGKSTLIRLILGLDRATKGTVLLFGQTPQHITRSRIGYVPQSLGLYPSLNAQENLDFTTSVFHKQKMNSLFSDNQQPVITMPLGTQRNLAVECALSHAPELLILDEPTSGMDALSRAMLWKTLRHAASCGVGVLITTHYEQEALQCDRLITLENGRRIQ
ncbi:ATP-binding cassette domain-containing protein [Corynebacterium freiburgense]|uniref:ATP-binding cassette domain-containing protein n=1 Tax=Corynebacterium freiburgense TaxID=556548 RepID=UPI000400D433|nr:ATP-binding cassette domain-containing protein [Corynebacterium freiburgense]WJZ01353.1 putative ABC transporter ATP-binding protein YbhF [Corynebacterium freiburgense]